MDRVNVDILAVIWQDGEIYEWYTEFFQYFLQLHVNLQLPQKKSLTKTTYTNR